MAGTTEFIPVGSIIAYAGEINSETVDSLEKQGWLFCDGSGKDIQKYNELYQTIKWNFGKPSEASFNIPDFRGIFQRGTGWNSGKDPDAASRTALYTGGNTGDNVGSYQNYGTGVAKNPFTANLYGSNIEEKYVDKGACVDSSGHYGPEGGGGNTDGTGGDHETRPVNKYVNYLIKTAMLDQYKEEVQIPIGSVIPFTAKLNASLQQNWVFCDGHELSNAGEYKALFEAVRYAHGKKSDGIFLLPDFRGYFLRGVTSTTDRDPDASTRTQPADGGNTGNNVGSVEQTATGYPVAGPFFTSIPHLPDNSETPAITGAVKTVFRWNGDTVNKVVTSGGGDNESRPVNMNVDWYIRFR